MQSRLLLLFTCAFISTAAVAEDLTLDLGCNSRIELSKTLSRGSSDQISYSLTISSPQVFNFGCEFEDDEDVDDVLTFSTKCGLAYDYYAAQVKLRAKRLAGAVKEHFVKHKEQYTRAAVAAALTWWLSLDESGELANQGILGNSSGAKNSEFQGESQGKDEENVEEPDQSGPSQASGDPSLVESEDLESNQGADRNDQRDQDEVEDTSDMGVHLANNQSFSGGTQMPLDPQAMSGATSAGPS